MDRETMLLNHLIIEWLSNGETSPVKLVEYNDGQIGVGIYYEKLIEQYLDNEYNHETAEAIWNALDITNNIFEKEIQGIVVELGERAIVLLIDDKDLAIPIKNCFVEQICPELKELDIM